MKFSRFSFRFSVQIMPILTLLATAAGCAHHSGARENKESVSYYDRNGDGKVDLEMHRYAGMADANWGLWDDNHDGKFEKKVLYGVAVTVSATDIPVPIQVPIEPNP
jgi:hypothetical protein